MKITFLPDAPAPANLSAASNPSSPSFYGSGFSRRDFLIVGIGLAALSPTLSLPQASAAQRTQTNGAPMSSGTITAKDGAQIYYKDWGTGQPIVFHHGWPLSADG